MKEKVGGIICYIVAIILIAIYILNEKTPYFNISGYSRLMVPVSGCFFAYLGGVLLSKYYGHNQLMKTNLWIFMTIYLTVFLTWTLFDTLLGVRHFALDQLFSQSFINYAKTHINLIPFKEITNYLQNFDSLFPTKLWVFNLLGNFVALIPMGFFVTILSDKKHSFLSYLIIMVLITLGIETLQFISMAGVFDIDDIILNTSGSLIMYFILQNKDVNALLRNIFLLEDNNLTLNNVYCFFISIILVELVTIGVINYRDFLYQRNLREANQLNNVGNGPVLDTLYKDPIVNNLWQDILKHKNNIQGALVEFNDYIGLIKK